MRRSIFILITVIAIPSACLAGGSGALRQTMAGYLANGADASALPEGHPLYTLRQAPVTATTAWLMFHDDASFLDDLYPVIERTVMDYFTERRTVSGNFVKGHLLDDGAVAVSPGLNSLAALDVHCLSLIASATGRYSEAIELRRLARDYTKAITEYFFDHTSALFLTVGEDGSYGSVYDPSQLLPLVIDGRVDGETGTRIAERLIYETARSGAAPGTLWDDAACRAMTISLLGGIDGFPVARLNTLPGTEIGTDVHPAWKELWAGDHGSVLFPAGDDLFVLTALMRYLDSERLMTGQLESLYADLDSLSSILAAKPFDLDTHVEAISTANRMLASLSTINTTISEGTRIWKIFEEYRWDQLSRRKQKRVTEALAIAPEELISAKRRSSLKLTSATGIHADIRLPARPVHSSGKISLEARVWTSDSRLDLQRIYLQAGSNRWSLTGSDESVSIVPGEAPRVWEKALGIPPGSGTGLKIIPVFFDFKSKGQRVEIHSMANVILTSGYDISLNYPVGRRLGNEPLPLNITVRHGKGHTLQGTVEGVFYSDLGINPPLPARFKLKAEDEITTLPLEIAPSPALPPGRYPFTIAVRVNGSTVAAFEDELVKNIEWLHLGPFPNRPWVVENATSLQSDLAGEHSLSDGRHITWSRVPIGAFDQDGSVRPDRLYGSGSDRCMLLYTSLRSDRRRKIRWKIVSGGNVNLWINEVPLKDGGTYGKTSSGITLLRKGHNALLLSSGWNGPPGPVMLELSDENGLPLADVVNNVEAVAKDFARAEASTAPPAPDRPYSTQPREVTFRIDDPGASEVSLIGEFNNWSPEAAPMKLTPAGEWSVTVFLPPGTYSYKFLVDRKTKLADPGATGSEPDGFGGMNSVIRIR